MTEQLKTFRLDQAKCAQEADRQFVKDRVSELYGDVSRFERFTQKSVQAKMRDQWGPHFEFGPLMAVRAISLPVVLLAVDVGLMLKHEDPMVVLHIEIGLILGIVVTLVVTSIKMVERGAVLFLDSCSTTSSSPVSSPYRFVSTLLRCALTDAWPCRKTPASKCQLWRCSSQSSV